EIMKKILCYGDSNTFGYKPDDGERYGKNSRWTGILQSKLGENFEIIEEGMCDRTGFVDNPKGFIFSAQKHFPELISNIDKVDIIILALGTNDLQLFYDINDKQIEDGLKILINLAKEKSDEIILIPPVILDENILKGSFNFQFDEKSIEKSKKVGEIYKKLAKTMDCKIFDFNEFVKPSKIDGLHYDENSHKLIAENLALYIT
ncbi:hypothetical protein IKQ21_03880, partial [bacterium]|nr:hypothetical protein [bacterium]